MLQEQPKPRSIFLLKEKQFRRIYNAEALAEIARMTENDSIVYTREDILADNADFTDVEIIFSGWGAPKMTVELLAALPSLKAFFYAAGTVKGLISDAFWQRNIILSSSYQMNAIPVAEFAVAAITFSLKRAWRFAAQVKRGENRIFEERPTIPGSYYGSRVGIISLGAIGRYVCKMLSHYDLDVFAYDPFVDEATFKASKAQSVQTLEELFRRCDVVSLHAPLLKETENLITPELLLSLPPGATFINTSRGAIVDEAGLYRVLKEREDLHAVLDILSDESAYHTHPLTNLPNVFLTPHIAGSAGRECFRMGHYAVEECKRYLNHEPPQTIIDQTTAKLMA